MLVDEAEVIFRAGHGGAGRVSFFPKAKSGPDGGSGGKGGNIFIKATTDLTALRPFTTKKEISAEVGEPGGKNQKDGHNGDDLIVDMPVGTVITVLDNGQEYELTKAEQEILLCKGGLGGKGNYALRSSRNTTPLFAQPGLPGEEKHCKIVLKLIAEYGFIGLPNAGKSSLLNELTATNVKVASYPFTTLEPNLGVLNGKILADIPGLIEGASKGKGLGIKFLKHIEKTKTLLHCLAADSEDLIKDYQIVRQELEEYNNELLKKEELIIITKTDLVDSKLLQNIIKPLKKINKNIHCVSIYNWEQVEELKRFLV